MGRRGGEKNFDAFAEAKRQLSGRYKSDGPVENRLSTVLENIRREEANRPVWNGPPLPQLVRLETLPVESRTVPIDKVDFGNSRQDLCGARGKKQQYFYFFPNKDIPGMDVGNQKTASPADCCNACVLDSRCQAWTHVDGNCWLKSGANKISPNKMGLTSGISLSSYNENIRDQVEFDAAITKIRSDKNRVNGKNTELMWPLVAKIFDWSGNRRAVRFSDGDGALKINDVMQNPLSQEDSNRLRRAFERHRPAMMPASVSANDSAVDILSPPLSIVQLKRVLHLTYPATRHSPSAGTMNETDDEAYMLNIKESDHIVVIHSTTVRGFLAGLESLSQICTAGFCNVSSVSIYDKPTYPHRGLLIDSGRRIIPVPVIYAILDGMAALRLNALHLHLTDWAGVRWKSSSFPRLNFKKRYYSKLDLHKLDLFATDRGITIYPEIDVPGHAHCFASVEKGEFLFCDTKKWQLFNDPGGTTLSNLKVLVREISSLFPNSPIIHIGGDETEDKGSCNKENFGALTLALQNEVSKVHHRRAVVWNEVPEVLSALNQKTGTIAQCWSPTCNISRLTSEGIFTIMSRYDSFYLDHTSTTCSLMDIASQRCLWDDIARNNGDTVYTRFLLGGEATMWTDEYCPHDKCVGHADTWGGKIGWLFHKRHDALFAQNFLSVIFPRLAAAAGTFYRFNSTLSKEMFLRRYLAASYRLDRRIYQEMQKHRHEHNLGQNLYTCPTVDCSGCTMTHRCDVTWEEYFRSAGVKIAK
jgi:hexosaminidase